MGINLWYNLDRDYTCAGSRPTKGRTVSEANRVHPPEGACRKTWYNLDKDYTSAGSRPNVERTKSEANRVHPLEGACPEDMV